MLPGSVKKELTLYYSLNKKSPIADFKEATIRGQAPDKGLYFPEKIPWIAPELMAQIEKVSNEELAFEVIKPFVGEVIPDTRLFEIIRETISFPIPLVQVNEDIYSLELYHGPTLAFKDVGARFMSRCLGYFVEEGIKGLDDSKKITVLVATSGDTGGAVASGFHEVEGIEVIILYPSGKVSPVQEKQLTALEGNIHALEIQGSFDDCQAMVKEAFADKEINQRLFLTSANSINVARWLPQQFYYFFAYKQWPDKSKPPIVSVPSGNFGNICAGILAKQTGLPLSYFIAACNINDVVTRYLQAGVFEIRKSKPTFSNAMDVGDPSNFIRIQEIFHNRFPELQKNLSSFSFNDKETLAAIHKVYREHDYLLDPHGAIGYMALEIMLGKLGGKGFFLETAHPVKFPDAVEKATGRIIALPEKLTSLMKKTRHSILMKPEYSALKEYLLYR